MSKSVVGLLACWQGWFGRYQNNHMWTIVPHCLMWCLWREINSRCFEDNERSISDLKLIFFWTLLYWLSALRNQSFSSFLDLCNFCIWFVDPFTLPMYQGHPVFYVNKFYYLTKNIRRIIKYAWWGD